MILAVGGVNTSHDAHQSIDAIHPLLASLMHARSYQLFVV